MVVEGTIGDASSLLPPLAADAASFDVIGLVYNGLVKYDRSMRPVGDLARSFEVSRDCRTVRFHLRPGVRWHDGAPFDADDVAFGWRVMRDPKTRTAYGSDFDLVDRVEARGPLDLVVRYRKPYAPGLMSWGSLVVLPRHLLEGRDVNTSDLARHPIGTGPFRFVEWKTQDRIRLEANRDYFEGRAYLDGFVYRVIPDLSTMFLELESGGIDWDPALTPLQFFRQTGGETFARSYAKVRFLTFSYTYLGWNLRDPLFADRRVRQALTMGIDKEELVRGVLLGAGVPAYGPYKPDHWVYAPGIEGRFPFDPTAARALLAEAGWRPDPRLGGTLVRDGVPFRFTIVTNSGNDLRLRAAQIIQRRLLDLGVAVRIRTVEWAAFLSEFIEKRRFQAVILAWQLGPEPDQFQIWHSSQQGPHQSNFLSYANPEVDRLLEAGRTTCDREERLRIYRRFQEDLVEDQPVTFLYFGEALNALHRRIRGVDPAPIGIDWNLPRWYVPVDEQRYATRPPALEP